jgi:hypothetical protein
MDGKILEEKLLILTMNNICSNFARNMLSGLADVGDENPKWGCWG